MLLYLGANLRRLRRECDLTQAELARRTGLDRSYISNLERGLRPTQDSHVDTLAAALEVDPGRLLARPRPLRASRRVAASAPVPRQTVPEALACAV